MNNTQKIIDTQRLLQLSRLKQKLAYVGWKNLGLINLGPLLFEVESEIDKIITKEKNEKHNRIL